MVVTLIEWEHLDNGKWKVKSKKVPAGKVDPDNPNYARKVERAFEQIWIYCEDCKVKYCLADPCIHHLSDSPEHQAKYKAYLAEQKKKQAQLKDTSDMSNKQERFI